MSTSDPEDKNLDELLAQLAQEPQPAPDYLLPRIIANLPAATSTPMSTVLNWLFGSIWRGAGVAALPILLGFVVGMNAGSLNLTGGEPILSESANTLDMESENIEDLIFVDPLFGAQEEEFSFDEI